MLQTILLCSDGSEDALHAARLTAAIAPKGARLIVLNVFNLAALTASYGYAPEAMPYTQVLIGTLEETQKEIVCRTSNILTEAGFACQPRCEIGSPVDVIVQIAEQEKADLIVLGNHGLTGIQRFLMGSVSDGVAHYAHCPVLIVRGKQTTIRQILVAFDGSEASGHAARNAAQLAASLSASLSILHVLEPGKPFPGLQPQDTDAAVYALRVRQDVTKHLETLLEGSSVNYRFCQEEGHPAEVITKFAGEQNFDLVVVGSRGLGGFKRLLLGSVSEAILHHAACPALVVR